MLNLDPNINYCYEQFNNIIIIYPSNLDGEKLQKNINELKKVIDKYIESLREYYRYDKDDKYKQNVDKIEKKFNNKNISPYRWHVYETANGLICLGDIPCRAKYVIQLDD